MKDLQKDEEMYATNIFFGKRRQFLSTAQAEGTLAAIMVERPVLQKITQTLPARTCTALVGRSGAGKSTLLNLLLRFMDPVKE